MQAIYLLLNLFFNSNIKFKFKINGNYIKILYILLLFHIYLLINMYIIKWNHES